MSASIELQEPAERRPDVESIIKDASETLGCVELLRQSVILCPVLFYSSVSIRIALYSVHL